MMVYYIAMIVSFGCVLIGNIDIANYNLLLGILVALVQGLKSNDSRNST